MYPLTDTAYTSYNIIRITNLISLRDSVRQLIADHRSVKQSVKVSDNVALSVVRFLLSQKYKCYMKHIKSYEYQFNWLSHQHVPIAQLVRC